MINIALAEDQVLSRKALEEKLSAFNDIRLVHAASNGTALLDQLIQNDAVDLILMDIEMPYMNGIETTERIKLKYPDIRIVMITIYDDDDNIFNAIKAGADSYILKETKAEKLYEAITDTLNGGAVMSPSIAVKTLRLLKNAPPPKAKRGTDEVLLSERETEILNQLSKGSSNKMIAENLFISPFTVKRHIENIYQKLRAHNRIELLEKARNNGLL